MVGGVGDWLDVPHNVILLDKYVATDKTAKARSISYQFSYGHVQYAGRGVVHRLEWDKFGDPFPRRPMNSFSSRFASNVVVSILDGGHAISLHQEEDESLSNSNSSRMDIVDDDDEGCIEASRLEQLVGRKQLYGCGVCVSWILQTAPKHPRFGIPELLKKLDEVLDTGGMVQIVNELADTTAQSKTASDNNIFSPSQAWKQLVEVVGFAQRPRKYEVGQALTRLHGIQMEEIPVEEEDSETVAMLEEERKKRALADLWAARRKK